MSKHEAWAERQDWHDYWIEQEYNETALAALQDREDRNGHHHD